MRHVLGQLLLGTLVLAGCKSHSAPSTTAQDSGPPAAAAAPAPAPAPAPKPAPTPAPAPVLAAGPALSYLKPSDPERCEWLRHPLPSGEPVAVFSFNGACDRSMVSWSPEGKEGLVFTWPSGEGEVQRAWRVDLATHKGKPLDLKTLPGGTGPAGPDKPSIQELGFDKQGRLVAILADVYVKRTPEKGLQGQRFLTFEGQRYPLPELVDGSPGLAHAYRLEEGSWKRVETKASGFESDFVPGIRVLDTVKTLGLIASAFPTEPELPGQEVSKSVAKKLDAALPLPEQHEEGKWMALSTPGGTVYYRGALGGELLYPSAPLAWEQGGKPVELEDLWAKPDDYLGLRLQEQWLLIANYADPHSAQVWDTKKKERVVAVEEASAPVFWPRPAPSQ
ncbi:MAG: hypothetical protein ACJ8AT_38870 [Hyalangium sp.]|uniref:hypothetical protein n=1 Tax=Hyalangium sp. TaxID=2028555 RepID=UPI00389AB5D7